MSAPAMSAIWFASNSDAVDRPKSSRQRLDTLDLVRGLVMVLMALDHTRNFFTIAKINPLDLTQTNAALFLTRWVTHFCAPIFVFLAGTGAFLAGTRGKTRSQLSRFLLSRGLWLLLLEFTLIRVCWSFQLDFKHPKGSVIWSIGGSMVILSGLVYLPTWLNTFLGIALIAGHNYFDSVSHESLGSWNYLWAPLMSGTPLMSGGVLQLGYGIQFQSRYPILPWLGVVLAGYGFGSIWLLQPRRRRRWLLVVGAGLVLLFAVLRAINGYGDPQHWTWQTSGLWSLFSFINCTKYPPSLLFVLMTLGPAILFMAWRDGGSLGPLGRILVTFGRVPLFYYIIHILLIHFVALFFGRAAGWGFNLPGVYAVWLGVVLALYPVCSWFAKVKSRHPSGWLSYL